MKSERRIKITRYVSSFFADEVFELPENDSKAVFDSELKDIMQFYSSKGEAFKVYKKPRSYSSPYDQEEWRSNFANTILFNLVKEEKMNFDLHYDVAYVRMVYMYAYGDDELIKSFFTFNKKYEEAYNFIKNPESYDTSSAIAKAIAGILIV